jgi:outer membrane protein OmpA-like peptidoglycan-associated protein
MNSAMNRVSKLIAGLLFLAAGAGGLVYVNVQLIPEVLSQQPAASAAAAPETPVPAVPEAAVAEPAEAPSARASGPADAAVDQEAAAGPSSPIKFELSQVTAKNLSKMLEPLAGHLKRTPEERVVLVGHGDPKTRTRDYVEVGRARALAVRRGLLEWGIIAARIQVRQVEGEEGQVKGTEQHAGTVEVQLLKGDK